MTTKDKQLPAYRDNQDNVIADGMVYKTLTGAFTLSSTVASGATTIGSATGIDSGTTYVIDADSALALTMTTLTTAARIQQITVYVDTDGVAVVLSGTAVVGLGVAGNTVSSVAGRTRRGDYITLHQSTHENTGVTASAWTVVAAKGAWVVSTV